MPLLAALFLLVYNARGPSFVKTKVTKEATRSGPTGASPAKGLRHGRATAKVEDGAPGSPFRSLSLLSHSCSNKHTNKQTGALPASRFLSRASRSPRCFRRVSGTDVGRFKARENIPITTGSRCDVTDAREA